jgi:hypothetical protein
MLELKRKKVQEFFFKKKQSILRIRNAPSLCVQGVGQQ